MEEKKEQLLSFSIEDQIKIINIQNQNKQKILINAFLGISMLSMAYLLVPPGIQIIRENIQKQELKEQKLLEDYQNHYSNIGLDSINKKIESYQKENQYLENLVNIIENTYIKGKLLKEEELFYQSDYLLNKIKSDANQYQENNIMKIKFMEDMKTKISSGLSLLPLKDYQRLNAFLSNDKDNTNDLMEKIEEFSSKMINKLLQVESKKTYLVEIINDFKSSMVNLKNERSLERNKKNKI